MGVEHVSEVARWYSSDGRRLVTEGWDKDDSFKGQVIRPCPWYGNIGRFQEGGKSLDGKGGAGRLIRMISSEKGGGKLGKTASDTTLTLVTSIVKGRMSGREKLWTHASSSDPPQTT